MKSTTASTTQMLLNHFLHQLWLHDWGYFVFAIVLLAIDAAVT